MLPKNFPIRKELRRKTAKERQEARYSRSSLEQLAKLDVMGLAAKKERAKLVKL